MAGLEITPGAVVASLEAMNTNLNKIIDDAQNMMYKIDELEYTKDVLVGESYDSIRNYYSDMHTSVMRATILFAEAMIQENNTYKGCVGGYLSGIGYVNEGALIKEKLELMEQIQWAYRLAYASKCGGYSSWISSMEHALRLVEKKLDQIDAFKAATAGLYQGISAYGDGVRAGIEGMGGVKLNGTNLAYSVDTIDNDWKSGIDELWNARARERMLEAKEPFIQNMMKYFGFDRNTSEIMYKLYMNMEAQGVTNINQEYFALFASYSYSNGDDGFNVHNLVWPYLAGTGMVEDIKQKLLGYGLTEDEIRALKGSIEANHSASCLSKQELFNNIIGENDINDDLIQSFNINKKYCHKIDLGHMSVTVATILNPNDTDIEKAGGGTGIFNGIYNLEANAGYVGDVYGAFGNGPKLTPDDYQADLDAVNLSVRLQHGENAIVVMNEYYSEIEAGEVNRAREFAVNIGSGDQQKGIAILEEQANDNNRNHNIKNALIQQTLSDLDYMGMGPLPSIQYQICDGHLEKEREKIVRNFIRCIKEEKNQYIEYETVDELFAEEGYFYE